MSHKSLIVEANERVSITLACQLAGVDIEDGRTEGSTKTYCPFGQFYHSDGGREPALRVYPQSNSAYCFSCKKYFSPVVLVSDAFGISKKQAAVELLDRVGYKPLSAAELWEGVQEREVSPDTSMLGMALKTYCARISPSWNKDQFESEISGVLNRCLQLLDAVRSDPDAEVWLTNSKEIMSRVLERKVLS